MVCHHLCSPLEGIELPALRVLCRGVGVVRLCRGHSVYALIAQLTRPFFLAQVAEGANCSVRVIFVYLPPARAVFLGASRRGRCTDLPCTNGAHAQLALTHNWRSRHKWRVCI